MYLPSGDKMTVLIDSECIRRGTNSNCPTVCDSVVAGTAMQSKKTKCVITTWRKQRKAYCVMEILDPALDRRSEVMAIWQSKLLSLAIEHSMLCQR
jgi:hypothetical protein